MLPEGVTTGQSGSSDSSLAYLEEGGSSIRAYHQSIPGSQPHWQQRQSSKHRANVSIISMIPVIIFLSVRFATLTLFPHQSSGPTGSGLPPNVDSNEGWTIRKVRVTMTKS